MCGTVVPMRAHRTPGPYGQALASDIRDKRRAALLTQAQLADLLNAEGSSIDRATISRWESGRRRPSLANLALLVSVLGVSEEIVRLAVNEPTVEAAA